MKILKSIGVVTVTERGWMMANCSKIIKTREATFSDELIQETFTLAFTGVPNEEKISIERCPKCNKAMNAINYNYSSGIIIDRCPDNCGVWLDDNELEKVQAHIEKNEEDFQKDKEEWMSLAQSVSINHKEIKDENDKRNMRPAHYLVNTIIRKMFKF